MATILTMGRVKERGREKVESGITAPTMAIVVMEKAKVRETSFVEVARDRITVLMMPPIAREKEKARVGKDMIQAIFTIVKAKVRVKVIIVTKVTEKEREKGKVE
jgi:hypothetical protein